MRMAGSGQEENRNNTYPHKVTFWDYFAQCSISS